MFTFDLGIASSGSFAGWYQSRHPGLCLAQFAVPRNLNVFTINFGLGIARMRQSSGKFAGWHQSRHSRVMLGSICNKLAVPSEPLIIPTLT